ncbi:MAG: sugar ABC transporter permease [Chloroflexi bacterium]|uniref:Sugar ABC transporter permease n=1 Tax=Candidatus Chlorohelix allophototropha TaxID=3003348 RepID=A0A8T7M5Q4_9CHLR|nr:sugar ABC transporter permease [Chloroflexota bacterium]WJW69279.1 sugar ABC transporter permease [Chloroflexota bacterium L227-S17]
MIKSAKPLAATEPVWNKRAAFNRREAIAFYLCISPWLIGFVVFVAGPMLASFLLSFTRWDYFTPIKWVGTRNYERIMEDEAFWTSLRVTFTFAALYVPLSQIISLGVALLLAQKIKGVSFFRTIFYLPAILSGTAYVVLWVWLFEPDKGLINNLLDGLGIKGPRWLSDPNTALYALVIMSLWGLGSSLITYIAGLKGIPEQFYEAAELDGAGKFGRFRYITIPMLSPTIFFNLVLVLIQTFQSYTTAAVATGGGPLDSTLFYLVYLYRRAFVNQEAGYAAALAWILFIIILLFTLLVVRSSSAWVYYENEAGKERRK